MLGHPASLADEAEGEGVMRYFSLCTDHKVVSIKYIVGIGVFFLVGGINAMLIRTELLQPNVHVFGPNQVRGAGGDARRDDDGDDDQRRAGPVRQLAGAADDRVAPDGVPASSRFTFWLLMAAGVVLVATIFMGGFPTGWTGYQPLGTRAPPAMTPTSGSSPWWACRCASWASTSW